MKVEDILPAGWLVANSKMEDMLPAAWMVPNMSHDGGGQPT